MRSRVEAAISGLSLSARDTVDSDTPASLAISAICRLFGGCEVRRRDPVIARWGLSTQQTLESADLRLQASGVLAHGVSTGDTGSCPQRYTRAGRLQFMLAWGRLRWCSPEASKQWRIVGEMPHEGGC